MNKIVFVSSNLDKLDQFKILFKDYDIEVLSFKPKINEIQSIDAKKVLDEKVQSIIENIHWFEYNKLPWFVDDSCLFLNCLNGYPGPLAKSMYQAIGAKGFVDLCAKYNDFSCIVQTNLALKLSPDSKIEYFSGSIRGKLQYSNSYLGHGFEDIFCPAGEIYTLSEMDENIRPFKNMRGKAFEYLIKYIIEYGLIK